MLLTGCGSYYQSVGKGSAVESDPYAHLMVGDDVLVELSDGTSRSGKVTEIHRDSICVEHDCFEWQDVATVGVRKYRTAATIGLVGVTVLGAVLIIGIVNDPGIGFPAD
jgi:multisubunit Na+/H+ antiporter MnhB subunit